MKNWKVALKIAQQLHFGRLQSFASLPDRMDQVSKREFNEFCVNLIMSFLEKEEARIDAMKDKSEQRDEIWKLCKTCFEYLIELKEYEILFRKTKIYFMRLDHNETFLALLEPFILRHKFKRIPSEYFNEVLSYFIEKKKFNVV